ncbi:hypothetical protein [Marixanthomonas ophiurae]|uniref:Sulfotransferase domain-containing protein n=1 Tax=Marixanthomonas ophiurae TaxID=387659 RepID=A0A3E1Q766_9FLAO|nr:hypothetical protein [Marixanthomonas ophiurae]RFN57969.1 hypothetical protein DZ858_12055 [Marixanthomonas ophiurae]
MKKVLITSIGRTGTVSLTQFLNTIDQVSCFHEKERQDVPFLFLSQLNQFSNITENYFKQRDIEASKMDCDFYIEVNPYFRFADKKILDSLGWEKVFIVRNPRTYLESVYTRNLYTKSDTTCGQFPDNSDPISKEWETLTRFQKLCWYYGKVHEYIAQSENSNYQFEKLTSSPEALKKLIFDIGIDQTRIENYHLPKRNTSFKNKIKRKISSTLKNESTVIKPLDWTKLSEDEMKFYNLYCKKPAKSLGYVL